MPGSTSSGVIPQTSPFPNDTFATGPTGTSIIPSTLPPLRTNYPYMTPTISSTSMTDSPTYSASTTPSMSHFNQGYSYSLDSNTRPAKSPRHGQEVPYPDIATQYSATPSPAEMQARNYYSFPQHQMSIPRSDNDATMGTTPTAAAYHNSQYATYAQPNATRPLPPRNQYSWTAN